jgi:hypothetical protein
MSTVRDLKKILAGLDDIGDSNVLDMPVAIAGTEFLYAWDGKVTFIPGGVLLGIAEELDDDGTPQ